MNHTTPNEYSLSLKKHKAEGRGQKEIGKCFFIYNESQKCSWDSLKRLKRNATDLSPELKFGLKAKTRFNGLKDFSSKLKLT
jgi:hypothetical protein